MYKLLASAFLFALLISNVFAQPASPKDIITQSALSINFLLNDYTTPVYIRSNSLAETLRNNRFARLKNMAPGIGIGYIKGVGNHIDFSTTLNTSFVVVPLPYKPDASDNNLLLEWDASVNLKLLTNRYLFDPYLIAGIGTSKYKTYFGAFMPLGIGLKINFFNEAAILVTTQYRVPVTTQTANYHFTHSVGIAGIIGQKKQ